MTDLSAVRGVVNEHKRMSVSDALETLDRADLGTDEVARLLMVIGNATSRLHKRKQLPCTDILAKEASMLEARYATTIENDVADESEKYGTEQF